MAPQKFVGATGTRTRILVLNRHVVSSAFVAPSKVRGDKIGKTIEHGLSTAGVITLHFARFEM